MRFAVKGDSHLGKSMGMFSRTEEIRRVYNAIIDRCIKEEVSALVDLGDIFDGNRPSSDLISMFLRWVTRLTEAGIDYIVTEGNHEKVHQPGRRSALEVLEAANFDPEKVHVSSWPEVFSIRQSALCILVPWVTRIEVKTREGAFEHKSMSDWLDGVLNEKQMLGSLRGCDLQERFQPIYLFGHVNLKGATVGKNIPYEPDDYVLPDWVLGDESPLDGIIVGHIHKTQIIQREPVPTMVLGTPHFNDFGEIGHDKGFVIIDTSRARRKS